jgi:EAL domain-containing protein (putative c-di-GMP-specific phosphodiesterase class I)
MISPALFIPIAEEVGLIAAIGEWVLEQARHEAATWSQNIKVAVNLSPTRPQNDNLVRAVCFSLNASGLPARRLELEITKSALLKDSDKVLAALHALRDLRNSRRSWEWPPRRRASKRWSNSTRSEGRDALMPKGTTSTDQNRRRK